MNKPEKKRETLSEFITRLAGVLVAALFIITFLVQTFVIPSGSMENTLLTGDHLFVDRLALARRAGYLGPLLPYRQVQRGDIIVFVHPVEPGMYVVKRVIGVPQDRIRLQNGVVYRNGAALNEPYTWHEPGGAVPYRDDFPSGSREGVGEIAPEWPMMMREHMQGDELVVPEGSYFGMGDNRDAGLDSRYWGFIPQENVIGRPLFVYWSLNAPASEYEPTSWGQRARSLLHEMIHFFGETRWRRMLHPVH